MSGVSRTEILEALARGGGVLSGSLCSVLGLSRESVNATLYAMEAEGLVARSLDVPPRWSLVSSLQAPNPVPVLGEGPVVVVDLGNVHDCLPNLLPYARKGLLSVRAYADLAFRGFGVNPSVEEELNCYLYQSRSSHRNAADSALVWDLAVLCERAQRVGRRLKFLVTTKDLGFQAVADLAREHGGHEVIFCSDWKGLRNHVE